VNDFGIEPDTFRLKYQILDGANLSFHNCGSALLRSEQIYLATTRPRSEAMRGTIQQV